MTLYKMTVNETAISNSRLRSYDAIDDLKSLETVETRTYRSRRHAREGSSRITRRVYLPSKCRGGSSLEGRIRSRRDMEDDL